MSRRKRIAIIACVAAALPAGWVAWEAWYVYAYGIDNAYAQWGAGDMVVGYLEAHEGRWPRRWEDLRPAFEQGGGRVGGWSFETYRRRIAIDFTADPAALAAASLRSATPPFDVIHPADGRDMRFEGMSGNEIVHRYLRWKAEKARSAGPGDSVPLHRRKPDEGHDR